MLLLLCRFDQYKLFFSDESAEVILLRLEK